MRNRQRTLRLVANNAFSVSLPPSQKKKQGLKGAEVARREEAATVMQAAYRGLQGRQVAADRYVECYCTVKKGLVQTIQHGKGKKNAARNISSLLRSVYEWMNSEDVCVCRDWISAGDGGRYGWVAT